MKTTIYKSRPDAPIIYLNSVKDDGKEIMKLTNHSFTLVVLSELDWNNNLTPWPSPSIFPDGEPFGGKADDYIRKLEEIISETEKDMTPEWRGIAGYSLAGLFALYSLYRTDLFSRAASVSGSLWYPGIRAFIASNALRKIPDSIYLSLGEKENKGKTASVLENTKAIGQHFKAQGINTAFVLNPGNHFTEPVKRTADALNWLVMSSELLHLS